MQATVICASRRYIDIKISADVCVSAIAESKANDIVAGDEVEYEKSNSQYIVKKVLPRKNCLIRCYRKTEKKLAANLDLILIVGAIAPLFNTSFIDRLIAAAQSENIECLLLVNKSDLKSAETEQLLQIYKKIGIKILEISALNGTGFDSLLSVISNPEIKKITLAGISGVGKSTILNRLVPLAKSRTNDVSLRTGQGKQTTSQSYAHTYKRENAEDLLIIDLPGLSNFGVTNLDKQSVKLFFSEFIEFQDKCQYRDCSHIKELNCSVKDAVEKEIISASRYDSYLEIIKEIDDAREY